MFIRKNPGNDEALRLPEGSQVQKIASELRDLLIDEKQSNIYLDVMLNPMKYVKQETMEEAINLAAASSKAVVNPFSLFSNPAPESMSKEENEEESPKASLR